jgi:hypothetical protein
VVRQAFVEVVDLEKDRLAVGQWRRLLLAAARHLHCRRI